MPPPHQTPPSAYLANPEILAEASYGTFRQTRQARPELLGVIDEAMTAINTASIRAPAANENSPSLSLPAPARENRKRRPDLHRPW